MVSHLFFLSPALIAANPHITVPSAYEVIGDYEDSFVYMRHAQILVDRFLAKADFIPKEEVRLGLNFTATLLAVKWAADDEIDFDYFLSLFYLERVMPWQRLKAMERVFLQTIDYQVSVSFSEINALSGRLLWENYSPDYQLFTIERNPILRMRHLFSLAPPLDAMRFYRHIPDGDEGTLFGVSMVALARLVHQVTKETFREIYVRAGLRNYLSYPHYCRCIARYCAYLEDRVNTGYDDASVDFGT